MMSYDKYERGRQHLNRVHQTITYKRNKNKSNTYPTAYPMESMGRIIKSFNNETVEQLMNIQQKSINTTFRYLCNLFMLCFKNC